MLLALPLGSKAATTLTYDFAAAAAEMTEDEIVLTKSATMIKTGVDGTQEGYVPNELTDLLKGNFTFFFRGECTQKLSKAEGGLCMSGSKDTYFSILNLKAGDKITITYSGKVLFCDKTIDYVEGVTSQWTDCVSEQSYTITRDCKVNLQWKKSKTVISKIVVETTAEESVSDPSIEVTAVNGINREVTINEGQGSFGTATKTYYTMDGTDPTAASTLYEAPFTISEAKTIKAISILDGSAVTSAIVSAEIAAGTEIKLMPTATITDVNESGVAYAFGVTNTDLIGNPTISYAYSFEGQTGTASEFTATQAGFLTITASAQGYGTSDPLEIAVSKFEMGPTLDFSLEDIIAADATDWTLNESGTRWSMWPKYNGGAYPYYAPADGEKGQIGGYTIIPGTNLLLKTIGFGHNSKTVNFSIADLKEYNAAKFIVRGTRMDEAGNFNVVASAVNDTVTYGIGAGDDGFALKAAILMKETQPKKNIAANIAELRKMADGTEVALTLNDAKVTLSESTGRMTMVMIEDATGAISIESGLQYTLSETFSKAGVALNGTLYGTFVNGYGIIGMDYSDNSAKSEITVSETTVTPTTMTIAEASTTDNVNRFVKFENAGMMKDEANYGAPYITQGDQKIELSDRFRKLDYEGEYGPMIFHDNLKYVSGIIVDGGDGSFIFMPAGNPAYEVATPAETATINFNDSINIACSSSTSTEGDITEDRTYTAGSLSMTITPSDGSTANRFWLNKEKPQLRVYGGKIFFEVPEGKAIKSLTLGTGKWNNGNTFNGVAAEKGEWTGNSTNIIMKVAGNTQINIVTVVVEDADAETTTYKEASEPLPVVNDIAAFKAIEKGTEAKLTVNAANVTFVDAKGNAYIEDATGALLVYNTGLTFTAGKAITGHLNGKLDIYGGTAEMVKGDSTSLSVFTEADATIAPTEMRVYDASAEAHISKYIMVKGAEMKFVEGEKDSLIIVQNGNEMYLYNKFGVNIDTTAVAGKNIVSISGIVCIYNGVYQLCPIADDFVAIEKDPVFKAFTENTVFLPTAANVTAAVEEGWIKGGENRVDNKKGNIDPATGEACSATAFEGVGLKKGNAAKKFIAYVSGVE